MSNLQAQEFQPTGQTNVNANFNSGNYYSGASGTQQQQQPSQAQDNNLGASQLNVSASLTQSSTAILLNTQAQAFVPKSKASAGAGAAQLTSIPQTQTFVPSGMQQQPQFVQQQTSLPYNQQFQQQPGNLFSQVQNGFGNVYNQQNYANYQNPPQQFNQGYPQQQPYYQPQVQFNNLNQSQFVQNTNPMMNMGGAPLSQSQFIPQSTPSFQPQQTLSQQVGTGLTQSLKLTSTEFKPAKTGTNTNTTSQVTSKVVSPRGSGLNQSSASFSTAQQASNQLNNFVQSQIVPPAPAQNLNLGASSFVPAFKKAAAAAFTTTTTTTTGATQGATQASQTAGAVASAAFNKLSETDKKSVQALITKFKSNSRVITLDLLREFKTLDIANQKPVYYNEELLIRKPIIQVLENKPQYGRNQGGQGGGFNKNQPGRGGPRKPYDNRGDRPNAGGEGQGDFSKNKFKQPHIRERRDEEILDPLVRAIVDQDKQKLQAQSKVAIEKARSSKSITQQIKLICNIITPDNFEKKFKELRTYLFGDLKHKNEEGWNPSMPVFTDHTAGADDTQAQENADNMKLIVERVFNKAQTEHEYCSFYGELCEKMIKLELNLRGLEAKKTTLKFSIFRKTLLNECKISFDQFFLQDKAKRQAMETEAMFRYQKRLFGNVKFVGELNRRNLLQESIIISVFNQLLGAQDQNQREYVNDDTVEGATVLMNKIGYIIDEKLVKLNSSSESKPSIIAKNKEIIADFNRIFAKFEEIASNEKEQYNDISLRVKILIKNMIDNRSGNWEKSKKQNEKGPKKVEELKKELEAKQREDERIRQLEYEEQQYGYDNQRRGGGGDRYKKSQTQYQKKGGRGGQGGYNDNYDSTSQSSYNDRGDRGTDRRQSQKTAGGAGNMKYAKKQHSGNENFPGEETSTRKVVQTQEMEDSVMAKKVNDNFHAYDEILQNAEGTIPADHFQIYQDLKNVYQKSGESIVYQFLNHVYDNHEDKIMTQLPNYLNDLIKTGFLTSSDFTQGVNKFLKAMPDLSADYPKISLYLSRTLFTLKQQSVLKYQDLVWIEEKKAATDEEDQPFVEQYYHLMAYLLNEELSSSGASWQDIVNLYTSTNLSKVFIEMLKPLILEDNLFSEVAANLKDVGADQKTIDAIVGMLQGDSVKVEANINIKLKL
eukprot:403356747